MNIVLGLMRWASESGFFGFFLFMLIMGLIFGFFVFVKYIYGERLRTVGDSMGTMMMKLDEHIRAGNKDYLRLVDTINDLAEKITKIDLVLVSRYITEADLKEDDWGLVSARLAETAEVTFFGAYAKACKGCDGGSCTFLMEFSELIEARRKESHHIWEREAIPTSIFTIVEQVNKDEYVKVLQQYIPDIVSICDNPIYEELDRKLILILIRQKVEVVIDKVKCDWNNAILKRVNLVKGS